MNSSTNNATEYSQDISPPIPREIVLHISQPPSTEKIVEGSIINSFSITPMEWLSQETSETDKFQGCAVSLSSSDCSSQDCSFIPVEECPLDFRMDWSEELENGLKSCMKQNPELFLVPEDKDTSDSNSLCSHLSDDYDMDSDMTGLWDGEQHDIPIPAWVSSHKEK